MQVWSASVDLICFSNIFLTRLNSMMDAGFSANQNLSNSKKR